MSEPGVNLSFGLIVISAPSGAGKSTLCSRLLSDLGSRLALSISTTSRPPRGQEQNAVEYFFVTAEEFKQKISEHGFAEWALVHGNYYGTSKKTLEQFWNSQKHVLLDIDVQGAASLRAAYGSRCKTIFISPPSMQELERRLRGRGTETEEAIQKRLKNAQAEMKEIDKFDFVLINDDFESAYQLLREKVQTYMDLFERAGSK